MYVLGASGCSEWEQEEQRPWEWACICSRALGGAACAPALPGPQGGKFQQSGSFYFLTSISLQSVMVTLVGRSAAPCWGGLVFASLAVLGCGLHTWVRPHRAGRKRLNLSPEPPGSVARALRWLKGCRLGGPGCTCRGAPSRSPGALQGGRPLQSAQTCPAGPRAQLAPGPPAGRGRGGQGRGGPTGPSLTHRKCGRLRSARVPPAPRPPRVPQSPPPGTWAGRNDLPGVQRVAVPGQGRGGLGAAVRPRPWCSASVCAGSSPRWVRAGSRVGGAHWLPFVLRRPSLLDGTPLSLWAPGAGPEDRATEIASGYECS